jgi:hypothetical protein
MDLPALGWWVDSFEYERIDGRGSNGEKMVGFNEEVQGCLSQESLLTEKFKMQRSGKITEKFKMQRSGKSSGGIPLKKTGPRARTPPISHHQNVQQSTSMTPPAPLSERLPDTPRNRFLKTLTRHRCFPEICGAESVTPPSPHRA